ncbi:hypothetical protein HMPREF0620_0206 [Parascardovia denticolens DSM 10105 = JCM 12538]|uniref:Uncharacterized protein n=1 Tax=Parascardovia denticolens DSM 10105 = JCM 12538 TaxID=864564 RepID=E6JZQ5_PARDN|nr:hypothetical protein HMPREF0620_0206 [Parascardovia denticolens DSM 10105 = JCM 12538]BAR05895.1 hypothetical protein PSDT_1376 [Parascardovia denticolens DSM 10105 = JCM 12538]
MQIHFPALPKSKIDMMRPDDSTVRWKFHRKFLMKPFMKERSWQRVKAKRKTSQRTGQSRKEESNNQ